MRYKFRSTKPRFPSFCRQMRKHLGVCLGILVFTSALGFFGSPVVGQGRPSVSSGSYVIRATYDECLTRARQALEAEGYPAGRGGEQYYWGGKGIHWAIILCEPPGGSRFSFHIFVHSGNPDARISDAERDNLARRMGQPNPASSGSCSWVGQWRLNGFNGAVMTLRQSGDNVTGEYPGWHNGRVTSGRVGQSDGMLNLAGTWENNYGVGDRGSYQITMSADCNSWNGKWNTANNSGTWSAVRIR